MKPLNVLIILFLAVGTLLSCTSQKEETNVVEVKALDFKFEAPEEIPSGWTTFRFKNEGLQEHFLYTYRLPDDKTFEEFKKAVTIPFIEVWDKYLSGDINQQETAEMLGTEIESWYFTEVVPTGGVAITEPGETAQSTVKLDPGTYVLECYVKMPDGRWHTEMGMVQPITVSEDSTGAKPPEANYEMTLTNYQISTSGNLKQGTNTVAVQVKDTPEGFMKHDINLFRMDDTTTVDDIVKWMNWMELDQFTAPAPAYSLGGVEHMAAGKTGYMTVDLEPGNYAWVSEGYGHQGMVKTFTIK